MSEALFEHTETFLTQAGVQNQGGDGSGHLRLGKLEALYQELYVAVIADGLITQDERAQLDKMADAFGLDRARLRQLEDALEAAYQAAHHPGEHIAVDIDLSELTSAAPSQSAPRAALSDGGYELQRHLETNPRDEASLHALFRHYEAEGNRDRAWCVAHVLAHLGVTNHAERACFDAHESTILIRPTQSFDAAAWHELVFHPDEDPHVGAIFAVVAPAVLLGRLSALRRDKQLPTFDPAKKQDVKLSTIQSVRCFSWAAAIFGMATPDLYVEPDQPKAVELIAAIPPALRLGAPALSGRTTEELAFLAGRHLTYFREEHIVVRLVPSIANLEQIFLAALHIGNPDLPPPTNPLVVHIARAIEPLLDLAAVNRLRTHVRRFIEAGGRANLQRWEAAVHKTAARAAFLLANDLRAARTMLELEDQIAPMDDLLLFATSDRYAELRRRVGVTLGAPD